MPLKLPKIGGVAYQKRRTFDPSDPWDPQHLQRDFARRDVEFKRVDLENHKRGRDIEVGAMPMIPPDPTQVNPVRLILTSPNGSRFSITVSNSGVISAVAL